MTDLQIPIPLELLTRIGKEFQVALERGHIIQDRALVRDLHNTLVDFDRSRQQVFPVQETISTEQFSEGG